MVRSAFASFSSRESRGFVAYFQREGRTAVLFVPHHKRRASICIMKTIHKKSLFVIPSVLCIELSYSNLFSGGSSFTSFFHTTFTARFSLSMRDAVPQLNRMNVGNPKIGSIAFSKNFTVTGSILHTISRSYLTDSHFLTYLAPCLSCTALPRGVAR